MAAKQLDELWDTQVASLNTSFATTMALLKEGKPTEAYDAYHTGFVPAVKKIYSEAASTYPLRFSGVDDWCTWVRTLYINTMKADKLLAAGKVDEARPLLTGLRESFTKLHAQTKTQKANDFVYALYQEVAKPEPDAAQVQTLHAQLAEAKPCSKAAAEEAPFTEAKAQWTKALEPVLADSKIDAGELPALRAAAEKLYHGYGMCFE